METLDRDVLATIEFDKRRLVAGREPGGPRFCRTKCDGRRRRAAVHRRDGARVLAWKKNGSVAAMQRGVGLPDTAPRMLAVPRGGIVTVRREVVLGGLLSISQRSDSPGRTPEQAIADATGR